MKEIYDSLKLLNALMKPNDLSLFHMLYGELDNQFSRHLVNKED